MPSCYHVFVFMKTVVSSFITIFLSLLFHATFPFSFSSSTLSPLFFRSFLSRHVFYFLCLSICLCARACVCMFLHNQLSTVSFLRFLCLCLCNEAWEFPIREGDNLYERQQTPDSNVFMRSANVYSETRLASCNRRCHTITTRMVMTSCMMYERVLWLGVIDV